MEIKIDAEDFVAVINNLDVANELNVALEEEIDALESGIEGSHRREEHAKSEMAKHKARMQVLYMIVKENAPTYAVMKKDYPEIESTWFDNEGVPT